VLLTTWPETYLLRRQPTLQASVHASHERHLSALTARRLRGTPLDVFGLPKLRRVERALIGEYRELVRALRTPEAAELADIVRGYEDIKLRNVERFRTRAAELSAR